MNPAASLPESLRLGVRFACTQCGACCSGAPGRVRVSGAEAAQIAAFLGQERMAWAADALRMTEDGGGLLKEQTNGDCIYFAEGSCAIHPVKPGQCRRYPFWFRNVRSEAAWQKTAAECPGIGEGPLHSTDSILMMVQEDMETLGCGA